MTDSPEARDSERPARRRGEPTGIVGAVGDLALLPARVAARRIVDEALSGSLPEEVTRALIEHRVIERVVTEALESGEFQGELVDRVLQSPEFHRALREVLASSEVREALKSQTTSFGSELLVSLRNAAIRLDGRAERAMRRRPRRAEVPYAGVPTRAIALATDIFLAQLIFTAATAILGVVASLVGDLKPAWLVGALLAAGWLLVVGGYFVVCWSTVGQTPAMRLMRLRVQARAGEPPHVGQSIVRLIGLVLAIIPFFAGFLPVFYDARRRGIHDMLARTTVTYENAEG
jgi:uncharacterized RDD family membrane protein YckC